MTASSRNWQAAISGSCPRRIKFTTDGASSGTSGGRDQQRRAELGCRKHISRQPCRHQARRGVGQHDRREPSKGAASRQRRRALQFPWTPGERALARKTATGRKRANHGEDDNGRSLITRGAPAMIPKDDQTESDNRRRHGQPGARHAQHASPAGP